MGAISTSEVIMAGSPDGLWLLKTATKTSPDTVRIPPEPNSDTLMSRPDTPRKLSDHPVSVPTLVRLSAAKMAEMAAAEYALVCHVAYGDAAS